MEATGKYRARSVMTLHPLRAAVVVCLRVLLARDLVKDQSH